MQLPRTRTDHGSLDRLNGLDAARATDELRACCAADAWLDAVLSGRPYASRDTLLETSDATIAAFDDDALAQALTAHARIGERRAGTSREDTWSREEQAAALAAGEDVQARLEQGNRDYERRFGHVFLIRAAGRGPEEMYDALQERLGNDEDTERAVVLHELAEIVRLRLERLVEA
jgi:2-oxo-4-hydroxy-4-carboxy-5-ureidoimidazoline decarboxylase